MDTLCKHDGEGTQGPGSPLDMPMGVSERLGGRARKARAREDDGPCLTGKRGYRRAIPTKKAPPLPPDTSKRVRRRFALATAVVFRCGHAL
jgi:hypothetical protein